MAGVGRGWSPPLLESGVRFGWEPAALAASLSCVDRLLCGVVGVVWCAEPAGAGVVVLVAVVVAFGAGFGAAVAVGE